MASFGLPRAVTRATVGGLLLAACSPAQAQASCDYDLYIYQPARGAPIYAVAGTGGAAALEVAGCGDARLMPEARAVVARLERLRAARNVNLVTIEGADSRTEIGSCSPREFARHQDRDEDNLVFVTGAGPAQMRRTIGTIDAAPRALRAQMISESGLQRCTVRR